MTRRYPVKSAPGPLEDYAARLDDLFGARAQRHAFRRYLDMEELRESRREGHQSEEVALMKR